MRRREFFKASMAATAALGTAGCSSIMPKMKIDQKITDISLEPTKPRPSGGTMPTGELGTSGIKVSKLAFGSHMSQPLLPFEKEREVMIREAYDFGINIFDIYEKRWNIFQYEPMGRHIAPIRNDVILSIFMDPYDGRTVEQEFERAMRLLGRDYIDLVRTQAFSEEDAYWEHWEVLFRLKEKGYIRAVGLPLHFIEDIPKTIELHDTYQFDFVVFPYNFYHNVIWDGRNGVDFGPMTAKLREKGVGIIGMKPLGSDHLVSGFINAAGKLDKFGDTSFAAAAHKYVINSGLNPDTVLNGMYSLDHIYENVATYYNPVMSKNEKNILEKVRRKTRVASSEMLPAHYKFLDQWAPSSHMS
ncbi:aldo/keto reductase [Candidatus Latescibacterota bacterium]